MHPECRQLPRLFRIACNGAQLDGDAGLQDPLCRDQVLGVATQGQQRQLYGVGTEPVPEVRIRGIAPHDVAPGLDVAIHDALIEVHPQHPPAVARTQHIVGRRPDSPHAEHEDLRVARAQRQVLGQALLALEAGQASRKTGVEALGLRAEGRGGEEGQGHGQCEDRQPLGRQPSGAHCDVPRDQTELAVRSQRHRGDPGRAGPQSEACEQPEEQDLLQRQEEQQQGGDCQHGQVGNAAQPDAQEEPHQQDILETEQGGGELLGLGVPACQHPHQQGAQVGLHADHAEQGDPQAEGQGDTEQDQQLAVPRLDHDQVNQWAQGDQPEQRDGPRGRQRAGRDGQEDHGEQVLDDENADRGASMQGRLLTPRLEHLHGEHGAREAEREPREERRSRLEATEDENQATEDAHREGSVDASGAPDVRPGERAQVELQADREQQEVDAGVRDRLECGTTLDPQSVQQEAGGQIADERR